jgi:glycine cleavage system H protein
MPKYLEMTADKFTFRVATDRLYSPEGVWILPEPDSTRVRVGVADYLQQHNGDVAFANVKPAGTRLAAGGQFAEIETIKAMVELHAPISGTMVEVNAALNAGPEAINQSPYEAGWLAVIEPSAWDGEHSTLLGPAAYFAVMQAQVQEDLKGL